MNRKKLLENSLTEEKNITAVITATTKADSKFLTRTKRDLEDKVEDLRDQLEKRLSSTQPLDKSVVESLYSSLKETEVVVSLYSQFEEDFITNK